MFPSSVLALFDEIKKIKETSVLFDNGKGEAEVHAPDMGDVGEEEEKKAFDLLEKLERELRLSGFLIDVFKRAEGIDAIRIHGVNNSGEKRMVMPAEKLDEFRCQTCGENIQKVICKTHEETYETGHKYECPYRPALRKDCIAE